MDDKTERERDPGFYDRERAATYPGEGDTFKDALDDAWEQIPQAEKDGRAYRVAEVWVEGTNPINWFKVILRG